MQNKIFMIARIYDQGKLVGFVLYDSNLCETKNVSCAQVIEAFQRGVKIENLTFNNNKFRGVGGNLARYSAINTVGNLLNTPSLVITHKGSTYYYAVEFSGKQLYIPIKEIFKYRNIKFANGKILYSDKSGYYISAIEGSFDTDIEKIGIRPTSKKYNIPKMSTELINSNQLSYSNGHYNSCCSAALVKGLKDITWVNKRFINNKAGIVFTTTRKDKLITLRAYNEILTCTTSEAKRPHETKHIAVGVTSLRIGDDTYFVLEQLQYNRLEAMLSDILYIGPGWVSAIQTGQIHGKYKIMDSRIIGLGTLGLMVIWLHEDEYTKPLLGENGKNSFALGISANSFTSLRKKCIPYDQIKDITSLTHKLTELGIGADVLDKSDLSRILIEAQNCPYTFQYDLDLLNEPTRPVRDIANIAGPELEQILKDNCIEYMGIVDVLSASSIRSGSISTNILTPFFLTQEVQIEIANSIEMDKPVRFNQMANCPILCSYSGVFFSKPNNKVIMRPEVMELKHLGYIQLFVDKKTSIIQEIPEVWVQKNHQMDVLLRQIWGADYTNNQLIIFIASYKIVYNLTDLINQYQKDMEELIQMKSATQKINTKMQMIGTGIKLDALSNLIDWPEDKIIEQTSKIKGITITSENKDKPLTIILQDNFDIIDKRDVTWRGVNLLRVLIKPSNLKLLRHYLSNRFIPGLKIGLDLTKANGDDVAQALSLIIQSQTPDIRVIIDGEKVNINNIKGTDKIYDLAFMVKSSVTFWSGKKHQEFSLKNTPIMNVDNMEASERSKVIKRALAGYNRKNYRAKEISGNIIRLIITTLCTPSEVNQVLEQFEKWS